MAGARMVLGLTGAVSLWMLSGFKESFSTYFEDDKISKTYWTGFATICASVLMVVLALKIFNIPFSELQKPINPVR
jgi:hypothetical protein